jgi:hypothetical protein
MLLRGKVCAYLTCRLMGDPAGTVTLLGLTQPEIELIDASVGLPRRLD